MFPGSGKGLGNLGPAPSLLPLLSTPCSQQKRQNVAHPADSPPPALLSRSLQAERLAKQLECPAWVPARLPRPRTLFSCHWIRGLCPQRPLAPWLIVVPTAHPEPRLSRAVGRPGVYEQPGRGETGAPGGPWPAPGSAAAPPPSRTPNHHL